MKTIIWPLILLSYFSLFVFGLSDNVRGPLYPEILREFSVSNTVGSLMFALSSFAGFITSFLARILFQKYDRRTILQGAAMGLTLTLIGLAFSPNFPLFLFFSATFGMNSGIIAQVPNIFIHHGSTPEKKQQLLAGLHAMYGIAGLIAPLLVAGVTAVTGNWRHSLLLTSLAPLSLLFYSLHKSHDPHHEKPRPLSSMELKHTRRQNLKGQVVLALMLSLTVSAEVMLSSRLALYMRRVWSYDLQLSSLFVTAFFIALWMGRLLFAAVKFNRGLRFQMSICLIMTAGFVSLGLFLHPFFLVAAGFSIAPFYPLAIAFISAEFPHDLGTAISYIMATDALLLTSMHLLVGRLTDFFGIHRAILASVFFLLASLLTMHGYHFFIKKNRARVAL